MPFRVFVIEDEADYATLVGYRLRKRAKVEARFFSSGEAALSNLQDQPDAIFLDVMMPGIGGLETLRTLREYSPRTPVIMLTSQTSKELVLRAMEYGAYDYVVKGQDDMKRIPILVNHLHKRKVLLKGAQAFIKQRPQFWGLPELLGESIMMEKAFLEVRRSLRGRSNIALIGEAGVGKTKFAQMLYRSLGDRLSPIFGINCRNNPNAGAKLFGTPANGNQAATPGLLRQARGGLLILENVTGLHPSIQKRLVQVLTNPKAGQPLDIQFLTTSDPSVATAVQKGQFAHQLYNFLFAYPISIPPLRERENDILLLAAYFRKSFLEANPQAPSRRFTPEARQALMRYKWPGNVSELKALVERALSNPQPSETIAPHDLFPKIKRTTQQRPTGQPPQRPTTRR